MDVKRAKIDVKIIKLTSAIYARYKLFQRLNSCGSTLTPQELRNCLIVSIDASALDWLEDLAREVSLPDRLVQEQYQLELVLRFLALHSLETVNQKVTSR